MGVTKVDTSAVASEILGVLRRNRVPVGYLDEVLDKVKESTIYFTPITGNGPIGVPVDHPREELRHARSGEDE